MTKAEAEAYYGEHLERVRRTYVNSRPWQRAGIARQRMAVPTCTPNLLITSVSATEGLARSVLLRLMTPEGKSPEVVYEKIRWWNPLRIIRKIASLTSTSPGELLGQADWIQLEWAIKYRHLLVHEGTFLNQVDGHRLIAATQRVFSKLEDVGRRMGLSRYGRPRNPRLR